MPPALVSVASPVAVTENVAVAPTGAVWPVGCAVMTGAPVAVWPSTFVRKAVAIGAGKAVAIDG